VNQNQMPLRTENEVTRALDCFLAEVRGALLETAPGIEAKKHYLGTLESGERLHVQTWIGVVKANSGTSSNGCRRH